jgi:hypothetical protein
VLNKMLVAAPIELREESTITPPAQAKLVAVLATITSSCQYGKIDFATNTTFSVPVCFAY